MVDQKPRKRKVKLVTTLFEFGEPLVALFKNNKSFFVASALPSDTGYVKEYLLVTVSPKYVKRYFREENDLRYLFETAPNRRFYVMDASDYGSEEVSIEEFQHDITEAMLPEPQFFAASHTSTPREFANSHDAHETLLIDGSWEMEDFGIFSARYRDIYSLEDAIQKLQEPSVPVVQRDKIIAIFNNHNLFGGSSYVNMFRELQNSIPANDQYELKKVYYASPGKIELNGKGVIFDALEEKVNTALSRSAVISERYKSLRDYMSEKGLLELSDQKVEVSAAMKAVIETRTTELSNALGLDYLNLLQQITNDHSVNVAKIVMAVSRRLKAASSYFAEGRAIYEK